MYHNLGIPHFSCAYYNTGIGEIGTTHYMGRCFCTFLIVFKPVGIKTRLLMFCYERGFCPFWASLNRCCWIKIEAKMMAFFRRLFKAQKMDKVG